MSDIRTRSFIITITDVSYHNPNFHYHHYRCLISEPVVSLSPLQMTDTTTRIYIITITDVWYHNPKFHYHNYSCLISEPEVSSPPLPIPAIGHDPVTEPFSSPPQHIRLESTLELSYIRLNLICAIFSCCHTKVL
jgi:hypothetical protein